MVCCQACSVIVGPKKARRRGVTIREDLILVSHSAGFRLSKEDHAKAMRELHQGVILIGAPF
jgi:hypothetical protein